jgi:hypothetical protein
MNMSKEFDSDYPRLPQMRSIKVGVFPFHRGSFGKQSVSRFRAYTTWYNPQLPGCCEHTVMAVTGTTAKKLAIEEHKENCLG